MIIREWENRSLEDGWTDEQRDASAFADKYDRMPFRTKQKILMNNPDFRKAYEAEVQDFIDSYSIEEMLSLNLLDGIPELVERFKNYLQDYYNDYYLDHPDIIECLESLPDSDYKEATDEMLDDLKWYVMSRDVLIPEIEEHMRDDILMNSEIYLRDYYG